MSKRIFTLPRGTADVLPENASLWQSLEKTSHSILSNFNFKEIRTPIFEESELFARSMGSTSDVVNKQMLNLSAQKKSEADDIALSGLSLRPENTASVVRSYIQNRLDKKEGLSKLYYIGPMFRGERPQKGRLRQFHQVGAEVIGPDALNPYLDAELIALAIKLIEGYGVKDYVLNINSLGSAEDKEKFAVQLKEQLKPHLSELSEESQDRYNRNVLRILDSKNKNDQKIIDKLDIGISILSEESQNYYGQVKKALDDLNIKYVESPKLVRGLDYYTHTVFEITGSSLGSQDALGAGGRYANLVEQLGGPKVNAIGFALGLERIILALKETDMATQGPKAFVVALDESSFTIAYDICHQIRDNELSADICFKQSSMKSQMRQADKSGASFVIIIGEQEVTEKQATIKNMSLGEQEKVAFKDIVDYLKKQ